MLIAKNMGSGETYQILCVLNVQSCIYHVDLELSDIFLSLPRICGGEKSSNSPWSNFITSTFLELKDSLMNSNIVEDAAKHAQY